MGYNRWFLFESAIEWKYCFRRYARSAFFFFIREYKKASRSGKCAHYQISIAFMTPAELCDGLFSLSVSKYSAPTKDFSFGFSTCLKSSVNGRRKSYFFSIWRLPKSNVEIWKKFDSPSRKNGCKRQSPLMFKMSQFPKRERSTAGEQFIIDKD